jgi:hypothetical protein
MLILITGRKGGGVGSVTVEFTEGLDTAYGAGNKLQMALAAPEKGAQPVGCEH